MLIDLCCLSRGCKFQKCSQVFNLLVFEYLVTSPSPVSSLYRWSLSQVIVYLVTSPSPVSSLYCWSLSQVSSIWSRTWVESQVFIAGVLVKSRVFGHESESSLKSLSLESESSFENLFRSLCQVSSLYCLSISQVSSIWSRVHVKSQVFIAGVKSRIFGHESESSLKSLSLESESSLEYLVTSPSRVSSHLIARKKIPFRILMYWNHPIYEPVLCYRQYIWSMICFVKKKRYLCFNTLPCSKQFFCNQIL